MYGYTRFVNTGNRNQGLSGYTYFYDLLEFFRHPSIFGRTHFVDMRPFPPEGVNLEFELTESPRFDTAVIAFGGRSEQRLALDADVRRGYKLRWRVLPPEEMRLVLAFFVARGGRHQRFTFTHPKTGERKVVRFALDAAEIDKFTAGLYAGHLELIEVNEPLI